MTLGRGTLRGTQLSTAGGLTLNALGGDIVLSGLATSGTFIDFDASGDISLAGASAGGTLDIDAGGALVSVGTLSAAAGDLDFTAGRFDLQALASAGNLHLDATAGDIILHQGLAAPGSIRLRAVGGITAIDGLELHALGGTLGLDASGIEASFVNLAAQSGILSADTDLTTAGSLRAITQAGNILTGALTAGSVDLQALAGKINAGNIVTGSAAFLAPGGITLGDVTATENLRFDYGTGLSTGALSIGGSLQVAAQDADASFAGCNWREHRHRGGQRQHLPRRHQRRVRPVAERDRR